MPFQIGIDVVRTDEVRESLAAHGERYLQRIYTDVEQQDCRSNPRRLAARLAAKEATVKALAPHDEALPWRSIGVARDTDGRLLIELSGPAADLAQRRGIRHLEVSLMDGRSQATAVVLAEMEEVR